MDLFGRVLSNYEKRDPVNADLFEEILKSEETMRKIDEAENKVWGCSWRNIWAYAVPEIKDKVLEVALQRAETFDDYESFAEANNDEALYAKALPLATQHYQYSQVANRSRSIEVCTNAVEGELKVSESVKDYLETLSTIHFVSAYLSQESRKKFAIMAITKGVALSKIICEARKIYRYAESHGKWSYWNVEHQEAYVVAKALVKSNISFEHKYLLKKQVSACRRCKRKRKSFESLRALLESIMEFGKYQHLKLWR